MSKVTTYRHEFIPKTTRKVMPILPHHKFALTAAPLVAECPKPQRKPPVEPFTIEKIGNILTKDEMLYLLPEGVRTEDYVQSDCVDYYYDVCNGL